MLLVVLVSPARGVDAQRLEVVPSLEITERYDDNVFYRPAAESDSTTRFSPRVDVRHGSERAILAARYALDADRFAAHPELSTPRAREEAGFDARYLASRRLSLSGVASYVASRTPADLNRETGLAPGRVRAERAVLQPSATYQVAARTETTVGYALTRDALAG